MAIRIIRICDGCGKEYSKTTILPEDMETIQEIIAFVCSDCILKEVIEAKKDAIRKSELP